MRDNPPLDVQQPDGPQREARRHEVQQPDYGRFIGDFARGDVYEHPFELTVDAGIIGPYMAGFLDATPLWASERTARAAGFPSRPVPPHLLLNLGLSFSVHDVSQQAIAHLAYVRVSFPKALPWGGTVRGASRVVDVRPSADGERGVVHVHTVLVDESGERVLDFERKALIRGGTSGRRPAAAWRLGSDDAMGRLPSSTPYDALAQARWPSGAWRPPTLGVWEDLRPGTVLLHANGRTVGDTEHMQLAAICRNGHPLHWDAIYCQSESFAHTRVVYGGLVLAWTLTQASMDIGTHLAWEVAWSDGAHPAPVVAGDTIFAATRVESARPLSDDLGEVTVRLVGTKNERPATLLARGLDLFGAERDKAKEDRIPSKVVEMTRTFLVWRRRDGRDG